jgi:hypothetical protein
MIRHISHSSTNDCYEPRLITRTGNFVSRAEESTSHTIGSSMNFIQESEGVPYDTQLVAEIHAVHSDTESTKPRTACQQVFETTELVEHIMSFFPMKKIFNVQRVSKQWRDIIANSPGLQEKMFLRLKTTPKERYEVHVLGWSDRALRWLNRPRQTLLTLVSVNPELPRHGKCRKRQFGMACTGCRKKVVLEWGPANIRQTFSLLDTYVSDPPCKEARVCLGVGFQGESSVFPVEISVHGVWVGSERGLTFQDFLRAALNSRNWICSDKVPGSKSYLMARDISLREAIGRLPEYTSTPTLLDCPVMQAKLILLDDVAAPTPEERATIAAAVRNEGTPK